MRKQGSQAPELYISARSLTQTSLQGSQGFRGIAYTAAECGSRQLSLLEVSKDVGGCRRVSSHLCGVTHQNFQASVLCCASALTTGEMLAARSAQLSHRIYWSAARLRHAGLPTSRSLVSTAVAMATKQRAIQTVTLDPAVFEKLEHIQARHCHAYGVRNMFRA